MAATLQQHPASNAATTPRPATNNSPTNPQLKRLVYSKYRELLGSYNGQANAYIDTLPAYMVHKDTGFNLELKNQLENNDVTQTEEMYGSGQRMPSQQTYEAPACVQNAMMTKDKKPFTYTPGGIDLSQIKSERMAKRLARNAQNEGTTGINQQNRPTQPQSPGGTSPSAAAAMGAAAMGMPFQVLPPPPPPPGPGKNFSGGSGPAPPPPPPPSSSSNFSNTGTLAPPTNGNSGGGRGSAPNSPNMPRKSPTPQRFEPPPLGFRPEIKIPPNPMAALRKVPPPIEKNTFWKDEYVKDRSKSPMVEVKPANNNNIEHNDSVNSNSSSPPQTTNAYNNGAATISNDNIDGFKKTMPTTNTTNNAPQYNPQTNNNTYTNYQQSQQQQQQQTYTPPTPNQSPLKPMQQSPQYTGTQTPSPIPQQQSNTSSRPEFRSVAAPTSPAVNIYTRQTDSPRSMENATQPNRATESPFKFAQQQQQQQSQQRAPPAVSPLAQQSTPSSASSGASVSPNPQAQATTVPWRTQRAPSQQQQHQQQPAPSVLAQSHPQPIYNNVQQPAQKSPDFSTQPMPYQGPKPTNVGSLYIAPLAPPTEPQAQHIVRQQLQQQQQQQQRDSPMRQMAPTQQQQPGQQLRWMSTQPQAKEQQPAWARPEENGNVVPSSLNRIKSPPTAAAATVQHGNGYVPPPPPPAQNFGAHPTMSTGLRLQINTPAANAQAQIQNGPRERIIPIQLEQTPTYAAAQPSFNTQAQQYAGGNNASATAPGYVVRTPNQFVDQGYNNFGQQQQQQSQPQRVMSPTVQQLNAPRMVQQTQNNVAGHKTHIIPIAMENNEGTRGPIVKTPIVIQNDQRTPPIQSKSFRILQKITDTIDDANNDDQQQQQQLQQQQQQQAEPQLQRPTFARQMSAQQARHSPTVEQMRRMQIGQEQGKSAPSTPLANKYYEQQQRYLYDNSQQYIPPSEQQVTEPKKYTGSAIPSRSFKILQAMTQPENAEEQQNSQIDQNQNQNENQKQNHNNEMNDIESEAEKHGNSFSMSSSTVEPVSSCSSSSINSELAFSSASASTSPSPTPPPTQPLPYPPYAYPYGYPWYPLPPMPPHMANQGGENTSTPVWPYPYGLPSTNTPPQASDHTNHYPPYPYYYPHPYYAPIPSMNSNPLQNNNNAINNQPSEQDLQNMYAPYMPPPPPYMAYPYPVAPSYSQSTTSSRASSVLPDIIITPSTDDVPSQVILKHHIKVKKEEKPKRAGSLEIDEMSTINSNKAGEGSVVDILTQHLENINKNLENNLNSKRQAKKSYKKNIEQKSPEDNTSPVQITMVHTESEKDLESEEDSDSEVTPKQVQKNGPVRLQSIKSVNNIKVYQGKPVNKESELSSSESNTESETEGEDDETTADGESDIFDEEEVEEEDNQFVLQMRQMQQNGEEVSHESDSDSEEFLIDDSLSVIYEEESEMEKSSDMAKTVIQGNGSTEHLEDMDAKIEENDCEDEEDHEDSTSVTVRLPLKFSFSKTKDAENIATVEVGKSHIEEQRKNTDDEQRRSFIEQQRKSTTISDEQRNSFSVATVKSDSDSDGEEYDDCDVSVTISLTPSSSKSNSLDCHKEHKNLADLYPIEDMPLPEDVLETIETSQEDVSVSFSLNMRNKFANETASTNSEITNNLANLENLVEKKEVAKVEEHPEELDFFATLMATKMQAQKIKEQSASYWGKSTESKVENKEEGKLSDQDNQKIPKEEKAKVNHDFGKPAPKKKSEEPQNKVNHDFVNQNSEKKTKEQEVNARLDFWNQYSNQKSESETKSKEVANVKTNQVEESNGAQIDFWNKYSDKAKTSSPAETEKIQEIEDIWANKTDEKLVTENEANNEIKKPKFSFWDHCSKATKEQEAKKTDCQSPENSIGKEVKKTECTTPEKSQEDVKKADCQASEKPQEAEDVSTKRPKEKVSKPKKLKKSSKTKKTSETAKKSEEIKPIANGVCETTSTTNNSDEVVDIWADRVDDLPPIKPIKVKLKSLESAKDSFWSTVAETQKPPEEIKKTLPLPQTVQKIIFRVPALTSQVQEVIQPQQATQHYEEVEELQEELPEQEEEVDFWAEIEKSRDSKTPEPNAFMSTFGEQEYSMYNDDHEPSTFDPLKYPEEPREVDTDEEIDFWAQIEAKRQAENDDDDVTFHKSASFWASRDRQNSVEETPYTPVITKAFKARLPDEPPCADLNIWQALEAHKGEEPVIIDPAVEEEKALVQEYEEMVENNQDDDAYSVHEPLKVTVWGNENQEEFPETETDYWSQIEAQKQLETAHAVQEPETDFWSHIDAQKQQETGQQEQEIEKESDTKTVRDELEIKRNNYRKAMAFFTTSIDDNKEQSTERYERSKSKSLRNSAVIEEETEKWDWEAVNEALQQETKKPVQEEVTVNPVDIVEIPAKLEKEVTPMPEIYVEPKLKRLPNGLPDLEVNKFIEERKISVKDRISAFETGSIDKDSSDERKNSINNQSLSVESYTRQSSLSRNSSTQRSESEMDEDDSGVTDMNKQLSETDTESESFPELRKMSSYQRAATHSRLFKLLQDDTELLDSTQQNDEFQLKPSRRRIVHNVSITRKQNPQALSEAETMSQRRERLSLPLRKNTSIDADNPSTPNSPASPIMGHTVNKNTMVSDKLVSELVQSLLLKSESCQFKNLPMEKLQAAAKRVLEEELDSLENTSVETTPNMTPNDSRKDKSYSDYYNTWSDALGTEEILPSKTFKAIQETTRPSRSRSPWTAKCPRVLSSKTINRDLSRVTESPEIFSRTSNSPECFRPTRESSVSKWRKS